MFLLRGAFLGKGEHEKVMTRLDEHEDELLDLAERVRELELEAELYARSVQDAKDKT